MGAVSKAIDRSNKLYDYAAKMPTEKASILGDGSSSGFSFGGNGLVSNRRFDRFRGWVYAAVNTIAKKAAGQPVYVGRLEGARLDNPSKPKNTHIINKAPDRIRKKAPLQQINIILDNELVYTLEHPNPMQHRWQFVYSFVTNICLTGWGYIFQGINSEGKMEFYSIPTSWVEPDHSKGLFAEFRIIDPTKPSSRENAPVFSREQVAFAYIPDPADPKKAIAPCTAQSNAIAIDEHIQSSQAVFFENGIFPSVVVTVGKQPHPDVPNGIRPRLTAAQRRQVYAAIKRVSGGVANYGNPAIVDGLIENITRMSATSNEMGWQESEQTIKKRILSAFGVHPFILGEEMAGSYAQAYEVKRIFCENINSYLDMLGICISSFVDAPREKNKETLIVWWEECIARDPSIEKGLWEGARNRDDVSQDEFRAYMGLPPDEDRNESLINKNVATTVLSVAEKVATRKISKEQGKAILIGMGLPDDVAEDIAGEALEIQQPMMGDNPQASNPSQGQNQDPQNPDEPRDREGEYDPVISP